MLKNERSRSLFAKQTRKFTKNLTICEIPIDKVGVVLLRLY